MVYMFLIPSRQCRPVGRLFGDPLTPARVLGGLVVLLASF